RRWRIARDRDPASDRCGQERCGTGLVAPEADLDLAGGVDRGAGNVRLLGEPPAGRVDAVRVAEDPNPQHLADSKPLPDIRDGPGGEHAAVIHDRDRGAELLQLREDVAADQDRLAEAAQLAE